ncbi:MAG TPA: monooxygenase, partial [Reyranella sp.]|nr:monooxygenase [Reyranella sp.]
MKHMPREDIAGAVRQWLAAFEQAIARSGEALDALFQPDSHWRDVLALTWRIDTVSGREAILDCLRGIAREMRPTALAIDPARTPPRRVRRAGAEAIEAIFRFETAIGRGEGVVRLVSDADGRPRAWTLLTALSELKGQEEQVG